MAWFKIFVFEVEAIFDVRLWDFFEAIEIELPHKWLHLWVPVKLWKDISHECLYVFHQYLLVAPTNHFAVFIIALN